MLMATTLDEQKRPSLLCEQILIAVTCCKQMACHACNGGIQQQHRLSGQSCESGVSSSSRQSYHSSASTGSSSSQGSLDRLEESGYSSTINVHELLRQGHAVRYRLFSLSCLPWLMFENEQKWLPVGEVTVYNDWRHLSFTGEPEHQIDNKPATNM